MTYPKASDFSLSLSLSFFSSFFERRMKGRKKKKVATGRASKANTQARGSMVVVAGSSLTYTKLDPVTRHEHESGELRSKGLSWTEWLIRIGAEGRAPLRGRTITRDVLSTVFLQLTYASRMYVCLSVCMYVCMYVCTESD